MLGQRSATMTLDRYGHPFDDRLDAVASRLDAVADACVAAEPSPAATCGSLAKALHWADT